MPRPDVLVLVTGTGTEVGKTWVAAGVARQLRGGGVAVGARKPLQSFEPGSGPTDAEILAAATGEAVTVVCSPGCSFPVPAAPPMAAEALGRDVPALAELVGSLGWAPGTEVGFVEGVGGPRSPLAADGDTVDLAERLDPDLVVLVADAGLGTINATLVSAAPFEAWRVLVVLNRFDAGADLHAANLEWLRDRAGLDVVTAPGEAAVALEGLLAARRG